MPLRKVCCETAGIFKIAQRSALVIVRRARKDKARGRMRKTLGPARKSLRSRKRQESLKLQLDLYPCSYPRLSRFTFIDESVFHFYVHCAIPIVSKRINPPRNSIARTACTLSLVLFKRTDHPRIKLDITSVTKKWTALSGDRYNSSPTQLRSYLTPR